MTCHVARFPSKLDKAKAFPKAEPKLPRVTYPKGRGMAASVGQPKRTVSKHGPDYLPNPVASVTNTSNGRGGYLVTADGIVRQQWGGLYKPEIGRINSAPGQPLFNRAKPKSNTDLAGRARNPNHVAPSVVIWQVGYKLERPDGTSKTVARERFRVAGSAKHPTRRTLKDGTIRITVD